MQNVQHGPMTDAIIGPLYVDGGQEAKFRVPIAGINRPEEVTQQYLGITTRHESVLGRSSQISKLL